MRIVHVTANDGRGGAALACWRLHQALREQNVWSRLLVADKVSEDRSVELLERVPTTDLHGATSSKVITQVYRDTNRTALTDAHFSLPLDGVDLSRHPAVQAAEVIHLHWVGSFQSPATVGALLSLRKPVVWTLHDTQPFTGGCHFPAGCHGFEETCSSCPQLRCDPFQLPFATLHDKRALWALHDLTVIAPSRWMADLAGTSALFRGMPHVRVLPHGVDTRVFRPAAREQALASLGLAPENRYLLCGSDQPRQQRKGFDQLGRALCASLADPRLMQTPVRVLWVGSPDSPWPNAEPPTISLGRLTSDAAMALAYAAADAFVLASLEDNLPNMLIEAISCGTPVVAYGVGGIPEVLTEGVNGSVVAPGDEHGLSEAIVEVLSNPALRARMAVGARASAEERYAYPGLAARHVELYADLLADRDARKRSVRRPAACPTGAPASMGEQPDLLLDALLPRLALHCLIHAQRMLQRELDASESERELQSRVIDDLRTELSARMNVIHRLEEELAARLRLLDEQELQRRRRELDVAAEIQLLQNELAARLRLLDEQELQRRRREMDVAAEIQLLQNELAARLRLLEVQELQYPQAEAEATDHTPAPGQVSDASPDIQPAGKPALLERLLSLGPWRARR